MDGKETLKYVDHTLLTQTATWEEIRKICDEAMEFGTASVCIPPSYVKAAKEYMKDHMAVCTFSSDFRSEERRVGKEC